MRVTSCFVALLLILFPACAGKSERLEQRPEQINGSGDIGMTQMQNTEHSGRLDSATFGAGCFWCVEAVFERIHGVVDVQVGYAGGHTDNPTYEQVSVGTTGHAEVIRITFDSDVVTFEELLDVFWSAHDPTTRDRQGADVGTQYRSVILYHDEVQREEAERSKHRVQSEFADSIVTEILPLTKYYVAENYHQDYYKNNRNAPYCRIVIDAKLRKLGLKEQ